MAFSFHNAAAGLSCLCLLLCSSRYARSQETNETTPIAIFRSRPDLNAPVMVTWNRIPELQAPGYYFVSPYKNREEAIHIYDNDGTMIWSGFGAQGPGVSHAPQVCQYKGESHLCFYQGTQMTGYGHGHGVIMNKHYQVVKTINPSGNHQGSSDMHEFFLLDDGKSALMSQFIPEVYDLCPWSLCDGLGYILDSGFQEVEVETGEPIFAWRALDHIDPSESWVGPGTTEISGSGEEPGSPWDYFHINSIDKNQDGDYLISARHVSAVYKISGKDGSVMWRLNGARSDYVLEGFGFSSQHDARWVEDNEEESVITIFDNGTNGYNQTEAWSTGKIIRINHKTKVATLDRVIDPPLVQDEGGDHHHIARSQGNFQRLPNGNMVLGWGNDAFWTEFTADGQVAWYGHIGYAYVMNYRVHKFDKWVGIPLTKPALWTYSKLGGSQDPMMLYVSWNGATEVRHWRFYSSNSRNGPWVEAALVQKTGFETIASLTTTSKWFYTQALDKDMRVLSTSRIQQTFSPNPMMLDYCDDLACQFMPDEETRESLRQEKADQEARKNAAAASALAAKAEEAMQEAMQEAWKRVQEHKAAFIAAASIGAFLSFVLILAVLCTRNLISRPLHMVLAKVWDRITGRRETRYGYYKEVRIDSDGESTPRISSGS